MRPHRAFKSPRGRWCPPPPCRLAHQQRELFNSRTFRAPVWPADRRDILSERGCVFRPVKRNIADLADPPRRESPFEEPAALRA